MKLKELKNLIAGITKGIDKYKLTYKEAVYCWQLGLTALLECRAMKGKK
jgi:hypothetical protein